MSRLENHAMLRDAATDIFNLQYALLHKCGLAAIKGVFLLLFCGKLIFWNNCSHERQIHSSGFSSIFAQRLKKESRGLL